MKNRLKIHFELHPDADGYPPFSVESVWGKPTDADDEYIINNVPFFATEATLGDRVRVQKKNGVLHFSEVVERAPNSLIRLAFFKPQQTKRVRDELVRLGCRTEAFSKVKLVAVNIPLDTTLTKVQEYLRAQRAQGILDFEEPILRHPEK